MNTPTLKKFASLLAFAAALSLPAFAQSTNTGNTTARSDADSNEQAKNIPVTTTPEKTTRPTARHSEDVVELETFTVVTEKDTGYLAVDALAGGRTAMELKFTPASVDALTKEFMDDFAITNIEESLQWATNVIAAPGIDSSNTPFNGWDYNFRGAGTSLQGGRGTKRNYNTSFQVADTYNVDRGEYGLGPNSILYGIGGPGGNVSTYTKSPRLGRNFLTVESSVNQFGNYRVTADYNQALSRKFGVRVNTLYTDGKNFRDGSDDMKIAGTLSLLWKPMSSTQVRLEVEASQSKGNVLRSAMNEQCSGWDFSSVADTSTTVLDPMPNGLSKQSANANYWVYLANNPAAGLLDYSTAYKSTGIGLKMSPYAGFYTGVIYHRSADNRYNPANIDYTGGIDPASVPMLPSDTFTWGCGIFDNRFQTLTFNIEHQFSPTFDMQINLYRYNDAQNQAEANNMNGGWSYDVNKQLPDGSPNPNFGKLYGDMNIQHQLQQREDSEARIQFNYRMKGTILSVPYVQRFSFGSSIEEMGYHAGTKAAINAVVSDTTALGIRRIYARQYVENPHVSLNLPDEASGVKVGYISAGNYDFDQSHKMSNAMLASHTMLWEDKVSVLLGARYDDYSYANQPKPSASNQTVVKTTAHKVTYSGGVVYYVIGDWLGLVANYSVNSDPIKINTNPGLFDTSLPTAQGKSTDIGIRLSFGKGNSRYYANFNRYFGKQINRQMNSGLINFGAMWTDHYNALGTTADDARTSLVYTDVQSLKLEGYECTFVAQPTQALNLRLSFAYPEVAELTESMTDSRRYFGEHIAEWEDSVEQGKMSGESSQINAATNLGNKIGNAINTLANNMAGQEQGQHIKYSVSGNISYDFKKGFFKGLRIGGGVSYQAKKYIGTIYGEKYYSAARTNGNFMASYKTKLFGYPTSIQLNLSNLLSDKDAVIVGYDSNWVYANGKAVPNNYSIAPPVTGQIKVRMEF